MLTAGNSQLFSCRFRRTLFVSRLQQQLLLLFEDLIVILEMWKWSRLACQ